MAKLQPVVKVSVKSTQPPQKCVYDVQLDQMGETPEQQLIFTNLAFDLIAVAMGKLGAAMSEAVLGNDTKLMAMIADVEKRAK